MEFKKDINKNKKKAPTDYKINDRVLVLTGDNKDRVGVVKGHYDSNLILEFKGYNEMPTYTDTVHYAEVIRWFDWS